MEVLLTAVQEGGQPALHVTWREIADRKQAEAALQMYHDQLEQRVKDRTVDLIASNQKLALEKKRTQEYLDVANVMMIALDSIGNISLINPKGCEILEVEAKDILGKNWFDLFLPEENREAIKDVFGRLLNGEDKLLTYYQNTIVTASGSERMLAFHNALLRDPDGKIRGVLSSGTDITDQIKSDEDKKKMQAVIFQQEKMASVGQLAAGVAHEINNPMGFITSNLSSLEKYFAKLLEYMDAQKEVINSIKEAGDDLAPLRKKLKIDYIREDISELLTESLDGSTRVKEIVQNLKNFSRLDEDNNKPSDINSGLESTIKVVWNEIKYNTTLKQEYGELPLVPCNARQLNQVFVNLLVNASHSIEENGEIRIKTWHDQESVYISISDNGCGIPKDKVAKIFEPFYTTKEVGKGTGLGLSISYDIIKSHNGNIKVVSKEGEGTCFTISLPLQEPQQVS